MEREKNQLCYNRTRIYYYMKSMQYYGLVSSLYYPSDVTLAEGGAGRAGLITYKKQANR